MAQDAWPFDDRDVAEAEWRKMAYLWRATGVIDGDGDELAVQQRAAGAALQVDVQAGNAWIVGHYFENDAVVEVAVPAPAANPRIDTIVVEYDFALNTRTIKRHAGAEAAAPAPPALTQNRTTKYELPLMDVYCPVGMVSVKTADDGANGYLLADRRVFSFDEARLCVLAPVRLATTAAMAASTITGNARVANANGAMANIDGTAPAVGDRILDKDHATTSARGVWVIESLGSATRPWRMRRAADMDEDHEVRGGAWIRVTEGSTLADTGWLLTTNDPISIGVTGLTFTQFPGSGGGANEIGYAEQTSSQTGIGTSMTDLTSLTTTVTVGANPIMVHGYVTFQKKGATGYTTLEIYDTTAGAALRNVRGAVVVVDDFVTIHVWARVAPAAGSRSYKLRALAQNNTTDTISGSSLYTAFIQVLEVV